MTDAAQDMVAAPAGRAPPIAEVLRAFVDGFNTNSLDDVMAFFAEDAVYEPGDGRTHRGRAAIRDVFRPQFSNAFGTMRFVVNDQVVDEGARKATIRWVCQHDFATMRPFPKRWLFKTMFGRRAGWYGTDIFHFDEQLRITGKYTYGGFRRPVMSKDEPER